MENLTDKLNDVLKFRWLSSSRRKIRMWYKMVNESFTINNIQCDQLIIEIFSTQQYLNYWERLKEQSADSLPKIYILRFIHTDQSIP